MSIPPKLVLVLAFLQALLIALGFIMTRGFLNLFEKTHSLEGLPLAQPGLSYFIHDFGLWFLIIPVGWVGFAIARGESAAGMGYIRSLDFFVGIVLTVLLAALFTVSAMASMNINFGR